MRESEGMSEQTTVGDSIEFKPRRAFSLTLIPAAVTGIFAAAGAAAWLFTGDKTALFLPLTGLFFYALVFLTAAALGYSYRITNKILILKNTYTRTKVNLRDISAVYRFSREQAQTFLTELETPWVSATRRRDFSLWGKTVRRNAEILRFMSVPLVTSSRSAGSKANITRFKALTEGEYLLIQSIDGTKRMITPRDTDALYRALLDAGARP